MGFYLGSIGESHPAPKDVKEEAKRLVKRYAGVRFRTPWIYDLTKTPPEYLTIPDDDNIAAHSFRFSTWGMIGAELFDDGDLQSGTQNWVLYMLVEPTTADAKAVVDAAGIKRPYVTAADIYVNKDGRVWSMEHLDERQLDSLPNDSPIYLTKKELLALGRQYVREKFGTGIVALYAGSAHYVDLKGKSVTAIPFALERGEILVNCKDIRVDYDDGYSLNAKRSDDYRSPSAKVIIHVPMALPVKPEDVPPLARPDELAIYERSYGPIHLESIGFPAAQIDSKGTITKEEWVKGHPVWGGHRGLHGWRR